MDHSWVRHDSFVSVCHNSSMNAPWRVRERIMRKDARTNTFTFFVKNFFWKSNFFSFLAWRRLVRVTCLSIEHRCRAVRGRCRAFHTWGMTNTSVDNYPEKTLKIQLPARDMNNSIRFYQSDYTRNSLNVSKETRINLKMRPTYVLKKTYEYAKRPTEQATHFPANPNTHDISYLLT